MDVYRPKGSAIAFFPEALGCSSNLPPKELHWQFTEPKGSVRRICECIGRLQAKRVAPINNLAAYIYLCLFAGGNVYVFNLRDVGKVSMQAGYKARALKQLMDAGLEVPEGFVIAAEAFSEFIAAAGIKGEIDGLLSSLNVRDKKMVEAASRRVQSLLLQAAVSSLLVKQVRDQYDELSLGSEVRRAGSAVLDLIKAGSQAFVAVRPSPPQWTVDVAFPTELQVFGVSNILDAVKRCWAATFAPENLAHMKSGLLVPAVVVQKMVNAEKSGSVFTSHPLGKPYLLMESSWGLGEWNSLLNPDTFEMDPATGLVVSQQIAVKQWMKKWDAATSRVLRYTLPLTMASQSSVDEKEIRELVAVSRRLPGNLCVEWCQERKKFFFLNAKPVRAAPAGEESDAETVLAGEALAGGCAAGKIALLSFSSSFSIGKGDIVVAKALLPELASLLENAGGAVVEEGGFSSFGAFFCRERGIPFLRADQATSRFRGGEEIVFCGHSLSFPVRKEEPLPEPVHRAIPPSAPLRQSDIRLMVSSIPEPVPATVGLIRPETCFPYGMLPLKSIRAEYEQTKQTFQSRLSQIAAASPQIVWYRLFDGRSDEVRVLGGGQEEPVEANPSLGLRGVKRILAQPEVYRFERDTIAELLPDHPNIGVLLSYLSSVEELKQFKAIHLPSLKLGMVVSTPAAAIAIEDFCAEGISHVCIDLDELAQLVLGVDRNNPTVSALFSSSHPAVLSLVHQVVESCTRYGVETSMTGSVLADPAAALQFQQLGVSVLFQPMGVPAFA